jgi:AmmeMemoRadiSam system protein A
MINGKTKVFLLKVARDAIKHYLENGEEMKVDPSEVPNADLIKDGACFVTLKYEGKLRGCIGTLEASRPLLIDVASNAVASAFSDPRFPMLTKAEFPHIKISISVLTEPEPFPVESPEDLLQKLIPHSHGLILQKGYYRATFLPCVWEQLPEKEEFLKHLSMKAGLPPEGWKDKDTRFMVYGSEEFSE